MIVYLLVKPRAIDVNAAWSGGWLTDLMLRADVRVTDASSDPAPAVSAGRARAGDELARAADVSRGA
jgi:hypothetical protein